MTIEYIINIAAGQNVILTNVIFSLLFSSFQEMKCRASIHYYWPILPLVCTHVLADRNCQLPQGLGEDLGALHCHQKSPGIGQLLRRGGRGEGGSVSARAFCQLLHAGWFVVPGWVNYRPVRSDQTG